MKKTLFILMLGMALNLNAEVYKWVDSDGNTHFSDVPHAGAETIVIPPTQSYSPPHHPAPPAPLTEDSSTVELNTTYTALNFIYPVDQATVRDNRGIMNVLLEIQPELQTGDTIELLLDGAAVGKPQITPAFTITGLNRGSHTLQAQIINPQGDILKSSETITIFLHRATVGHSN